MFHDPDLDKVGLVEHLNVSRQYFDLWSSP
jgi:hypothetical protein